MEKTAIAVKSFIVNNEGKLLVVKRSGTDVQNPGIWEIPGGKLSRGENPFEGLRRETREETGLEIDILNPIRVHHFKTHNDYTITMVTFFCRPLSSTVQLSHEHAEHNWIEMEGFESNINEAYHEDVKLLKKHFLSGR